MKKILLLAISFSLVLALSSATLAAEETPVVSTTGNLTDGFEVTMYLPESNRYVTAVYSPDEIMPAYYSICSHKNVDIHVGARISLTCTEAVYNYTEYCNDCSSIIKGGKLYMPINPPNHAMAYVTTGCTAKPGLPGSHTYENRCSKCGYASDSFTTSGLGGNCSSGQNSPPEGSDF